MRIGRIRALLCAALKLAALLVLSVLPVLASGRRAPDLKLENLQGQARKLSALRGHIVVVNFWATWCGPCQEELPRLSKLAQERAGKDVRFVAVSIDERKDQAKIGPMLERLQEAGGVNFEVFFANYEGLRHVETHVMVDTVPTAAEDEGDFSQSGVNIYDPATTAPNLN